MPHPFDGLFLPHVFFAVPADRVKQQGGMFGDETVLARGKGHDRGAAALAGDDRRGVQSAQPDHARQG